MLIVFMNVAAVQQHFDVISLLNVSISQTLHAKHVDCLFSGSNLPLRSKQENKFTSKVL